jgi:predicted phage terminase large subunit-like protein
MAWNDPKKRFDRLRAAADRMLAERSLKEFGKRAWEIVEPDTTFLDNWHQDAICEYLTAVTDGQIRRLIINMPPRYGKSFWVSVAWPCWEWLRNPSQRWMCVSYAAGLAIDLSLKRRNVVQSSWYRANWGDVISISTDQNIKAEFENTCRGKMFATSVGGTALGKGGKRIVIDDPHNPEQADSEVERSKAITFFDKTLYGRLDDKKRGAIVVVMQRLHQDDLSGHLESQGGWEVLKLEGRAEKARTVSVPSGKVYRRDEGEPLWPEREDAETLDETERNMTPAVFAGQYQQRPTPSGGSLIKVNKLIRRPIAPPMAMTVRYWDKAATPGLSGGRLRRGAARSAGVKMGRAVDGTFWILNVVKGQWSPRDREDVMRQTAAADGPDVPIWMEQEGGSGGIESAQNSVMNLAPYEAHFERVTGEKVVRARPLAAQIEAGNVYIIEDSWTKDFIDEAELFPNGRFADQIDAAAGGFMKIALSYDVTEAEVGGVRPTLANFLSF